MPQHTLAIFKELRLRPEEFVQILVDRVGFQRVEIARPLPGEVASFARDLLIAWKSP